MRTPPQCPAVAPVHAWALEAKIKAEQAQSKQQEWAEKMQRQYLRGQEVLKVLQEKREFNDEQPDEANTDKASTAGGAFDRFVSLMGLREESPSGAKKDASIEQTPQSKASRKWEPATPPKNSSKTTAWQRKSGEKENKFSPIASKSSDAEAQISKRGRRRGKLTFQ
jgi:hypothetical protein